MACYRRKMIVFFSTIILFLPFNLFAHGVKGKIDYGAVVITALYDTGEGMCYAKVNVMAPEVQLPFQSGRTDKNGRFSFSPDIPGDWKVVVDDEMGHRLEMKVPVDKSLAVSPTHQTETVGRHSQCKYQRAFMGICIIFGVLGLVFWWKGKKGEHKKIAQN